MAFVAEAVFKGAFPRLSLVRVSDTENAAKALLGQPFQAWTDPLSNEYKRFPGRRFDAVLCDDLPPDALAQAIPPRKAHRVICLSHQDPKKFPESAVVLSRPLTIEQLQQQFHTWNLL